MFPEPKQLHVHFVFMHKAPCGVCHVHTDCYLLELPYKEKPKGLRFPPRDLDICSDCAEAVWEQLDSISRADEVVQKH